jgi:hypothetical protein
MAYEHYQAPLYFYGPRGAGDMLSLWRRHLKTCPHRKKGRLCTKCPCPIWCDGDVDGRRVRKSLDTSDWGRATRKLAVIEDPAYGLRECAQPGCTELVERGRCPRHTRTVPAAIAAYHEAHQDASPGTKLSRRATLKHLEEFLAGRGVVTVDQSSRGSERTSFNPEREPANLDKRTRDIAALLPVLSR